MSTFQSREDLQTINVNSYPEDQLKRYPDLGYTRILAGPFKGSTCLNPTPTDPNYRLISRSFGTCEEVVLKDEENFQPRDDSYYTVGCQGPLVFVFRNPSNGEIFFSTTKNIDASNSFWGNKNEKFGELFEFGGGKAFLDSLPNDGSTPHFMIMTNELMYSTRLSLKGNSCVIVYLGNIYADGTIVNLPFSEEVGYFGPFIPSPEFLLGRVFVPIPLQPEVVEPFIKNGLGCGPETVIEHQMKEVEGPDGQKSYVCIAVRKIIGEGMKKREENLGNVPNVTSHLFTFFEKARIPKKGLDTFWDDKDMNIFPSDDRIKSFYDSGQNFVYIPDEWKFSETPTDPNSMEFRARNLLVIYLLSCPLEKQRIAIDAFFKWNEMRNIRLARFLSAHNADIIQGKYSEHEKFHTKAIQRLNVLANQSHSYAFETAKRGKRNFKEALEYSIGGLVNNEYGPSLYRLMKLLDVIQK